ncbi:MAG: heparan-alpha-glucosaminide N-acetyltransferase domain-containing protein [Bacteroidota bacterium]
MNDKHNRIAQLDVMRGAAVMAMVLGHSIDALLSPDVKTTELYRLYDFARGFTAPVFLVLSGFAFSVATERRWAGYTQPSIFLMRRLFKILMLLAIGYALHFPFFSLGKILLNTKPEEYARFFRVDVLQCVGVGVLLLQGLVLVSRTPRRFAAAALGAGVMVTVMTPIVWNTDFSAFLPRFLIPYLNEQQASLFPLFPYGAYMFFGAAAGHAYLKAAASGRERVILKLLLAAGGAAFAAGLAADHIPLQLYPVHDYWKASPSIILIRTGVVLAVTSLVFTFEGIPPLLSRNARLLGKFSLLVYAAHIPLVYGSSISPGLAQAVGQTFSLPTTVALASGVLLSMLALVHLIAYMRQNLRRPLRFAQVGLACSLLYIFLTNPY